MCICFGFSLKYLHCLTHKFLIYVLVSTHLSAAIADGGKPRLALNTPTVSTDYAALDRFRSRVGSIVRPTVESPISNRNLQQQPCKSYIILPSTKLYIHLKFLFTELQYQTYWFEVSV